MSALACTRLRLSMHRIIGVELTEAVPACTPARCQMDKSAATMTGLTNGVSYRFTVTATNEFGDQ